MKRGIKLISTALSAVLIFAGFEPLKANAATRQRIEDRYPDATYYANEYEAFEDFKVFVHNLETDQFKWCYYTDNVTVGLKKLVDDYFDLNAYDINEFVYCSANTMGGSYSTLIGTDIGVACETFRRAKRLDCNDGSLEEHHAAIAQASQIAQQWAGLSDYDKIQAIVKWECDNLTYDHSYYNHSLVSAMRDRKCVCEGYAQVFEVMAESLGLDSKIVRGDAGGPHDWNAVKLDGKWYYVDVTNADRDNDLATPYINYYFVLFGTDDLNARVQCPNGGYIQANYQVSTSLNISATRYGTYTSPCTPPTPPESAVSTRPSTVLGSFTFPRPSTSTTTTPATVITSTPSQTNESGVDGFVERLYTVALGRPSDPVGKANWIAALQNGMTGADAARGFLFSDEFLNKNMNNTEFVDILYRTFFDREADAAGRSSWVSALNRGESKQSVIMGFINSNEWANVCRGYGILPGGTGTASANVEVEPNDNIIAFATRLYTTCLKRTPDQNGLMAWARQLANHADTGTNAAHGFFFSDEMNNSPVSNEEFVTRLYLTFMDREPDAAGFDAWVSQLYAGVSREEVFQGFAQSNEFGEICSRYGIIR